jgi:aspartokinase-like uncharacterized kinase
MWVVKVGGSLARSPHLADWIRALAGEGARPVIIVPGGGPFADLVRDEQRRVGFPDAAAHRMAILAMEQFGFMLEPMHPRLCTAGTGAELLSALESGRVPVWLPYPMVMRDESMPQDWTVTADSLSLWLAIHLQAEALLLVKSARAVPGEPGMLVRDGLLDAHFPALSRGYGGQVRVLGAGDAGRFSDALRAGRLPGTAVKSADATAPAALSFM